MVRLEHTVVREPAVETVQQFASRPWRLAAAYAVLMLASLAGIVLLVWKGQFFVTLSQRTNVETLTIAFLLVFFGYLAVISMPGLWGALRLARFGLQARFGDRAAAEQAKDAALAPLRGQPPSVVLDVMVVGEGGPLRFELADEYGSLGVIAVDGATVTHQHTRGEGSYSVLAFLVHQINRCLRQREERPVEIIGWGSTDDDLVAFLVSFTTFARNLEERLGGGPLWPRVVLTAAEEQRIQAALRAVVPALRNEALLPHWEYAAEHKLPLIPEPLGLVSLSRSERRADPVATMGCAVVVVLVILAIVVLLIVVPPWVPGA
ncbi:MAG: hypothetical protein K6U89_05830 [Chloroflexi bacterium]|nr:hypothetical protein [Chloroflexota bacterium]GIW09912.1 MAG: hypothetical protein KatS3mg061_0969 [Dehalococcoidia bacterium]